MNQSTKKPNPTLKRLSVDLHGCSCKEAAHLLDNELPKWVREAQMGQRPFVIKVDIICGSGAQALADTVQKWIRMNKQVANRPKSFC